MNFARLSLPASVSRTLTNGTINSRHEFSAFLVTTFGGVKNDFHLYHMLDSSNLVLQNNDEFLIVKSHEEAVEYVNDMFELLDKGIDLEISETLEALQLQREERELLMHLEENDPQEEWEERLYSMYAM